MAERFTLTGLTIVDPHQRQHDGVNIVVHEGLIEEIGDVVLGEEVPCHGLVASPSLVDIATNVDIPGSPGVNGLKRALTSAARGGYTCISPLSTRHQPIETIAQVIDGMELAFAQNMAAIAPVAALTQHHEGRAMTDVGALYKQGVRAFGDGARAQASTRTMRLAMQYASSWPVRILSMSQDQALSEGAVVTACGYAETLGLPTQPKVAEMMGIQRDIALAQSLGLGIHIQGVSTRASVEVIAQAKAQGLDITCDTSPYHAIWCLEDIPPYTYPATFYPPLRERDDVLAIQDGLGAGTIDAIASYHQAVNPSMRQYEYVLIPPGLPTLEHTLALVMTHLVDPHAGFATRGNGALSQFEAIDVLSRKPAGVRGIDHHGGPIHVGGFASMVIYDPQATYRVDAPPNQVNGGNPVLHGRPLRGVITHTLMEGKITYQRGTHG